MSAYEPLRSVKPPQELKTLPPVLAWSLLLSVLFILGAAVWGVTNPVKSSPDHRGRVDVVRPWMDLQLPTL